MYEQNSNVWEQRTHESPVCHAKLVIYGLAEEGQLSAIIYKRISGDRVYFKGGGAMSVHFLLRLWSNQVDIV